MVAGDRPEQDRLASAVRSDDPDPLATLRGEKRHASHEVRLGGRSARTVDRASTRQVSDGQALDPDDDLTRSRRSLPHQRAVGMASRRPGRRRLAAVGLEALQPRLVLVHLAELAVTPIALDELAFARDRLRLRLDVLDRPCVAFDALSVVGGIVAAERGQPPIAELPHPRHRRVQKGTVVRSDQERTGASAEVLFEPLQHVKVEVVRWFVEQQEVRVGNDQARQRRTRLLAAGQGRRRLGPLVRGEPKPGQRGVDALVEGVPAVELELMLEVCIRGLRDPSFAFVCRETLGHEVEVCCTRPDRRSQVRRSHERRVEMRFLGEQPEGQSALAVDLSRSGSSRPAASRRSVVLPAPFGPTSPIRSPSAIDAVIESRITNVPTSRVTPDIRRMLMARRPGR